jgi:hypothetical protein
MRAKQTVTRLKVPSDKVWDAMRSAASGVRMLIKHQVLVQ